MAVWQMPGRRDWVSGLAAALLAAALFASPAQFWAPTRWLQAISIDVLYAMQRLLPAADMPSSPAVVIALDEETYRRPPFAEKPTVMWTPELAQVLKAVLDGGASVVGFDIVLPTSMEGFVPGMERPFLLALRDGARPLPGQLHGRVVLGRVQHQVKPIEPYPAQRIAVGQERNIRLLNALEDEDGVIRRHPLHFLWRSGEGGILPQPSMAAELAARKLGAAPAADESILLNFDTAAGAVPAYSLADLQACAARNDADFFARHFKDKVVLIGVTLDVEDRKLTSMRWATQPDAAAAAPRCVLQPMKDLLRGDLRRDSIPGVFIHATAVNNLLRGDALHELPPGGNFAALLLAGLAAAFATLRLPPLRAALAVAAVALLWSVAAAALFNVGWVLPLLNGLAAILVGYMLLVAYRFALADRDKRALRQAFALYLPHAVIDRMIEEGRPPALGGEQREVTVLFSDIAGFTKVSERLGPGELVAALNEYFAAMTSIVEGHGGFVDKFVGDAVVAVFGAPVNDGKHAQHAVRAALHMNRVMRQEKGFRLGQDAPIHIRIGLNTGPVLIGNIGSPRRFNYTAMGDAVNLASRLEGANKMFGTGILVSDSTRNACGDAVLFREIDRVRVLGRDAPVTVYEPLARNGRLNPADPRRAAPFAAALALWRKGDFAAAEQAFRALHDDPSAAVFARRCAARKAAGAGSWDGVTDLTEK